MHSADVLANAIAKVFAIQQNIRPILSCAAQFIKKWYELFLLNITYSRDTNNPTF
jgi:hypothetical protein